MGRLLKILGWTFLGMYSLFCLGLYVAQDYLIFDPSPLPMDFDFEIGKEVSIEVGEGVNLNCLMLDEEGNNEVILYLHGTRGNNRRCSRQANNFRGNGKAVFMPDYRGYGKSSGKITSEKQLFADVQKVYDYLKEKYAESNITILGYSLGTGMASYLAANNNPKQLILLAPFVNIADLKNRRLPFIPSFLLRYQLDNYKYLSDVKCNVTVFHGTLDEVIPYDSSERLQALNPLNIQLFSLEGAGHRRSVFHPSFLNGLKNLNVN